jgi:hypothetical protein
LKTVYVLLYRPSGSDWRPEAYSVHAIYASRELAEASRAMKYFPSKCRIEPWLVIEEPDCWLAEK